MAKMPQGVTKQKGESGVPVSAGPGAAELPKPAAGAGRHSPWALLSAADGV